MLVVISNCRKLAEFTAKITKVKNLVAITNY